jgi:hypothetical protein
MQIYRNEIMDYLIIHDILDKIVDCLKDVDLCRLMSTCIYMRNYIGPSDVWKKIKPNMDLDGIAEFIDGEKLFDFFLSINFNKGTFAMRDYYGPWYYLYVLKTWITRCHYWSVHSLIRNPTGIVKLKKLSGFLLEHDVSYSDWIVSIPCVSEKLSKINHDDKNKILKSIYIGVDCYSRRSHRYQITIVVDIFKRSSSSDIDISYNYYTGGDFSIRQNGLLRYVSLWDFSHAIKDISAKLGVNFNTLFDIIIILLGKPDYVFDSVVGKYVQTMQEVD